MQYNPFHKKFLRTRKAIERQTIRVLRKYADRIIEISYPQNHQSELARLCELHGSDKGAITNANLTNTYTDFYEILFWQSRHTIKNVFECGIGRDNPEVKKVKGGNGFPGASLRVWRDYFPNAKIVGADILENVLFREERIETYCVDQTDPQSIANFLGKLDDREFNIIIDDGLHEYHAGITLFENMIHRLSADGVYIIEDNSTGRLCRYAEYFQGTTDYSVRFINLRHPQRRLLGGALVQIVKK